MTAKLFELFLDKIANFPCWKLEETAVTHVLCTQKEYLLKRASKKVYETGLYKNYRNTIE